MSGRPARADINIRFPVNINFVVRDSFCERNLSQKKDSPAIARHVVTEMVRGIFILSLSRQRTRKHVV